MERIKAELGSDAVILSTRNFREGGAPCCEITAALERLPDEARTRRGNGNGASGAGGAASAPDTAHPAMAPQTTQGMAGPGCDGPAPGWGQWHSEWNTIKEHLLAFMKPHLDLGVLAPRQRLALEYLEREGLAPEVSLRLYEALRSDATASVLGPLGQMVATREWSAANWRGKFHALAGPAGVGKSSALIRMALACKRENPDLRVCLINCDTRSAGRFLLQHYADLSDFAYMEAGNAAAFATAVREGRKFDKVFVDLPNIVRGETLAGLEKSLGLDAAPDLSIHLVLAPYYVTAQFAAFQRQYYTPRATSIVWTKLDEAQSYAALVNAAAATGLPVSGLSFGPGLKDTLAGARADVVWRLIFKHQLPCAGNDRAEAA
ncbi:MAG: hypothetical protein AB7E47_11965 [Desulfovibrionaceae bacterium]